MNDWELTGLLSDLTNEQKVECSKLLEECFSLCIKDEEKPSEFFGLLFPLIRRLFDEKNFVIPSISFIFDDFYDYYQKHNQMHKDIQYIALDWERELIDCYIFHLNPEHKFLQL